MTPSRQPPKTRPHYDNCLMLSMDGKPMTTIANKKVDWYLEGDLARLVDYHDSRFERVIQLKFRHKSNSELREADLQLVENKYVVCGRTDDLSLHHVTPYRIKRMFPKDQKDHTRHLCVLVCGKHHTQAEQVAATIPDAHKVFSHFMQWITRWVHIMFSWLRHPYFWLWRLKYGNIQKINQMYVDAFMKLDPKYLPKGWLQ